MSRHGTRCCQFAVGIQWRCTAMICSRKYKKSYDAIISVRIVRFVFLRCIEPYEDIKSDFQNTFSERGVAVKRFIFSMN